VKHKFQHAKSRLQCRVQTDKMSHQTALAAQCG